MTDDRTLAALDQRGQAAAAGVRAAVVEHPVPAFDPDLVRIAIDEAAAGAGPRRSRTTVGLLAAAAAVLVVVAAVVALSAPGDRDSAPADRVAPGDVRPYALAEAPEGLGLMSVLRGSDSEPGDAAGLDGPATVFGPDPSRPLLATTFVPPFDGAGCDLPDAPADCEPEPHDATAGLPEIELGGRRAWDASENMGGVSLMVEVGDQLALVFGSPAFTDAIRNAAAAVGAGGEVPAVPDEALPDGWTAVGEVPFMSALGGVIQGRSVPVGAAGWTLTYVPFDDEGEEFEVVAVSVEAGGPLEVGLPGLLADEVEEVQVRGHAGRLARLDLDGPTPATTWWTIRWEERSGEVVEVAVTSSTHRFASADVLAMAEALVAVGPDELGPLREEARQFGLEAPGITVVGEGRFSDGAGWTLVAEDIAGRAELSIRTDVASIGGTAGVSMGPELGPDGEPIASDEPFPEGVSIESGAEYGWAFARVRDDVHAVEVRSSSGERVTTAAPIGPEGLRSVVAEIPAELADAGSDGEGVAVVALDADGAELGRLDLVQEPG